MNFNTYGTHYANFHQCSVSLMRQNIIVFEFGTSSYETWLIARMFPPDLVSIDSNKPLLLGLKTFFKSDVPASVVCNEKYLWTVCLGSERIIYPVGKEVRKENSLQLYATPYYVHSINVIHQYLQGMIRPAYENVFFYKNAVLYLDNEDAPYPGGNYFQKCDPTPYYRICFLSDQPTDYVLNLAAEWQSRQDVKTIPYLTREVKAIPKFIDFRPVSQTQFPEMNLLSTGIIHKTLSSRKPEHFIQDVLNAYYSDSTRRSYDNPKDSLGLLIEWPFLLTFEGARANENTDSVKTFVALSVNGMHPNRVLHVYRPYDRYIECTNVPATLWTPISFTLATLLSDVNIRKVALESVVLGVVYRETFFCFSQPLLEGKPTRKMNVNGNYILSKATFELKEDKNIQILESVKLNDLYSLRRVSLKGLRGTLDTWCLTNSLNTDPFPKKFQLPGLVKQWTDFIMEVGEKTFDVDVSAVRLALMLSKHNLCFNLNAVENPNQVIRLSEKEVNFYLEENIIQFINDARLIKNEASVERSCVVS